MNEADEIKIVVPSKMGGRTFRAFLGDALPLEPEKLVTKLIISGEALVNGESRDPKSVLEGNDIISVPDLDAARKAMELRVVRAPVLYEDEDIVVFNKPAGCATVRPRHSEDCPFQHGVLEYLRKSPEKLQALSRTMYRPRAVHRLDRDTSGAVIISKSEAGEKALFKQFLERTVKKEYLAIVTGEMEAGAVIDAPIADHPTDLARMVIHNREGKQSESTVEVVERFRAFTLVRVTPRTGRRHQVRIHLAHIGYPIAADETYGGGLDVMLSHIKRGYRHKQDEPEKPLIARPALHAAALTFVPPRAEAELRVEAPLPDDMTTLLKMLRKYAGR